MDSLIAAYILSLIGGLNWRFGLWSLPASLPASLPDDGTCNCPHCTFSKLKRERRKNRMIWLKGGIARTFVLFAIAWLVMVHFGWIQINSWRALFVWGVPYLLIAWVLNLFATFFEEVCIFNLDVKDSALSDGVMDAWIIYFLGLLVIYVVVRFLVWISAA